MFGIQMVGTRTEQLWTIQNPNVFGIRAPTVQVKHMQSLKHNVHGIRALWKTGNLTDKVFWSRESLWAQELQFTLENGAMEFDMDTESW